MISNNAPLSPSVTQTAYRAPFAETTDKASHGQDDERTVNKERKPSGDTLTPEQQAQLRQLQKTDRSVRAHEMAHVAASGGLASSGASYSYQTGPDGQRYAVSGEVSIDTSAGRTPEETLAKATRIRAAALAPADPSPQDRKVAAMADRMAMQALTEISTREREQPVGQAENTTAERPADEERSARIGNAYQANSEVTTSGLAVNAYA